MQGRRVALVGAGVRLGVGLPLVPGRVREWVNAGAQGSLWWGWEFGWGSGFCLRWGGCESGGTQGRRGAKIALVGVGVRLGVGLLLAPGRREWVNAKAQGRKGRSGGGGSSAGGRASACAGAGARVGERKGAGAQRALWRVREWVNVRAQGRSGGCGGGGRQGR